MYIYMYIYISLSLSLSLYSSIYLCIITLVCCQGGVVPLRKQKKNGGTQGQVLNKMGGHKVR